MTNNIDYMLNSQIPIKEKKKGTKIIIFLMILAVIVVLAVLGVLYYLKNQNKITTKDEFFKYLGKSNFQSLFNLEKINNLNDKFQNESSESTTEITGNISSLFWESELDLSDFKLEVVSKNNPQEKKTSSDISLLYKDNEVLNLNALSDEEKIGIISKDIVVKYLGSKYSNLGDVLSKIAGDSEISSIDLNALKNIQMVKPQISNEIFSKYINAIIQKMPETAFSSKGISLERNNGKVNVTEFSMKLTESQIIELIDLMAKTFESDDELLNIIVSSLGGENLELKEGIKLVVEQLISTLYEKAPDDTNIYTVNVYGANDVIYKIAIDLYGENSVDIDFDYSDKSNSVKITILNKEQQSGYSIDIEKTLSEVNENLKMTASLVEKSEIVGKVEFLTDLTNSGNSYILKNKIDVNLGITKVNIQINSKINFKDVEIEELTSDNCILLDEQNEENLKEIYNAVSLRAEQVINENFIKQGLEPLTENYELNTAPPSNLNPEGEKEEAKSKIIKYVSQAMGKAEKEGKQYKLADLKDLNIPDSTYSVSIDGDIAIVNIDGFEFKINSTFQIY